MYSICERDCCISEQQTAIRNGEGVEHQLVRIAQTVSDGFQERQRSVVALFDFSKAFDTTSLATKTPQHSDRKTTKYVPWLSLILENQQACVRFNEIISHSRKNHQVHLQGSVLSPLVFFLHIDSLNKIPEMSGKHRKGPTIEENTKKLQVKLIDVTK